VLAPWFRFRAHKKAGGRLHPSALTEQIFPLLLACPDAPSGWYTRRSRCFFGTSRCSMANHPSLHARQRPTCAAASGLVAPPVSHRRSTKPIYGGGGHPWRNGASPGKVNRDNDLRCAKGCAIWRNVWRTPGLIRPIGETAENAGNASLDRRSQATRKRERPE